MLATNPVLLVEDNDGVRASLALLLESRGYRVVQARDGQEAWEYLERGGCPSVIVLDIMMPRLDARLFRERQLDREECASIPVIVFTATNERLPDVAAVVRKMDPESLLETIDRVASVKAVRD